MNYPPPFLQENIDPSPSMILRKSQPPINKGEFTLWQQDLYLPVALLPAQPIFNVIKIFESY